MDQRGSTWINRLQPSAFSLQPSACPPWLTCHGSCVMAHVSCVMAHVSCVMRQTHGSCVMRQTHGSCVMRQASDSWLMRHASHASGSWLMRHASWLMAHASCVLTHGSCAVRPDSWLMRPASCVRRQASDSTCPHSAAPFSPFSRRPLSVMTTTKRRHFPHAIPFRFASDLRPLRCMAWGNRVVLPTPYSAMGEIVRIKTGCGAHSNAAACFYSYEKGRHNAGPVPD